MAIAIQIPLRDRVYKCQYVYPPRWEGDKERECKRCASYRIGQDIFLCGAHMPGTKVNSIALLEKKEPVRHYMKPGGDIKLSPVMCGASVNYTDFITSSKGQVTCQRCLHCMYIHGL